MPGSDRRNPISPDDQEQNKADGGRSIDSSQGSVERSKRGQKLTGHDSCQVERREHGRKRAGGGRQADESSMAALRIPLHESIERNPEESRYELQEGKPATVSARPQVGSDRLCARGGRLGRLSISQRGRKTFLIVSGSNL